jgi:ATP-dependent helicase/nuclease subunit A
MTAPLRSQWEAIADADRHTLVVAGAGTGKTFTVVHRILYMLGVPVNGVAYEQPVSLEEIAAITFTNQAARELREDLRAALRLAGRRDDAYRLDEARIGTIHGFCTDLLREHALRRGSNPSVRALEEGEAMARAMLAARDALIEALERGDISGLPELLGMWETSKVDQWIVALMNRPDLIRNSIADTDLDDRERALVMLADLGLRKHEERLARDGAVDFDRMILWTRDLLRDDPLARRSLQRRLRLLVIDEFQDVDPVQKEIAYAIGEPGGDDATPRLMLVGDPKQSIYRFRRADVSVWNEVQREFGGHPGCAVHALVENFRSRPAILGFVDATAGKWLDHPLEKDAAGLDDFEVAYQPVQAQRDAGPVAAPVELIITPAKPNGRAFSVREIRTAEAAVIARRASELHAYGLRWRDMALLLPAWAEEPIYTRALRAAGVPVYVLRDVGFYDQREIVDLIVALQAVRDPTDDVALFGFLRGPFIGLRDESLLSIAREFRPAYWWRLSDVDLNDEEENDRLSRARQLLWQWIQLRDRVHPAELLDGMMRETGFLAHLALRGDDGRQAIANVRLFLAMTRAVERAAIGDILRTIRESREREDRVAQAKLFGSGEDVLLITSIHVSKGLEWPVVFWANLSCGKPVFNEELLLGRESLRLGTPDKAADEADDWKALYDRLRKESDAERKRLWYVASTRARDRLIVSGIACGQTTDTPGTAMLGLFPEIADESTNTFSYTGQDGVAYQGIIERASVSAASAEDADETEEEESSALEPVDEELVVPGVDDLRVRAAALTVEPGVMPSPAGLTRHSATEFLTHARCPRRHWFRYTVGIREPEIEAADERLVSAVARGQIVHNVLERHEADLELDTLLEDAIGRWDESAPTPANERGLRYRRHLTDEVTRVLEHPDYAGMVNRPGAGRELGFLRIRPDGTAIQGYIDLAAPTKSGDGIELLDVKTTQCDAAAAKRKAAQYAPQRDVYAAAASAISAAPVTRFAFQFSRAREHVASNLTADDVKRAEENVNDWVQSIERASKNVTPYPAECGFCGYRRAGLCPGANEDNEEERGIVGEHPEKGKRTVPNQESVLGRLRRDRFRASFRLGARERAELERKGLEAILQDARDFIAARIAPAAPTNDGAQTPWRGHPVFVAQHATATCCRICLERWHAIEKGRELEANELAYIVAIIASWLRAAVTPHAHPGDDSRPASADTTARSKGSNDDQLKLF